MWGGKRLDDTRTEVTTMLADLGYYEMRSLDQIQRLETVLHRIHKVANADTIPSDEALAMIRGWVQQLRDSED